MAPPTAIRVLADSSVEPASAQNTRNRYVLTRVVLALGAALVDFVALRLRAAAGGVLWSI
ncbi:MAG: hypothetical protein JRH01_04730 [Deltaproteobacteria bacterium]|nr:hypothetical protein [Deltaproteobacteria bacterium]